MGLSSVGITLFLLPFCVSPRPQNLVSKTSELRMEKALDLEAKAPEVSLGMGEAFDLEMVEDDSRAKLNSVRRKLKEHQQGGLVQSMALTCPPPVASFLSLDDQPYKNVNSEYVHLARKEVVYLYSSYLKVILIN